MTAAPPETEQQRITVVLIPKAAADLSSLQKRTSLGKTDIVNRAISLYEFVEGQLADGREVLVRDADGLVQVVRLL